jgi:uncharacterized protein DUF5615
VRVLLDESLPRQLAEELNDLEVHSVTSQRWSGLSNGLLIQRALSAGFTVLLTADQNIPHQQNIAASGLSVIILVARTNRIQDLRHLVPPIRQALAVIEPGQVIRLTS